jgi:hypothetical protein
MAEGRKTGQFLAEQDKAMTYASRRVVELQAPWSVDKQWHRR